MTTVPGHNQILQQSGVAHDLAQQAHSPKPSPDQAAAIQQAQEVLQNSSIQGTEGSERLKRQKKREERREERLRAKEAKKRKKRDRKEALALDPNAKGCLLDTRV